jgi:ribosome-interacting GTPase 1
MAANLTPQYLEAEAEYKKAQTAEDRLACLRQMYSLLPKHKASEKLQAELKTKMSDTRRELEQERRQPKKGGISAKFPKQGAGQYVILGGPNAGKSQLLCRLSRATPAVAPYPFTTHEPSAGMMSYEDVRVQLIDTPPITADFMETYLSSMVRNADAAILMVDLGDDDGPFAAETVLERLRATKTELIGRPPDLDDITDFSIEYIKTMLVANKIDLPGAPERLEVIRDMFADRFPIHVIAAEHGTGLEELRAAVYQFLDVIRVYTKKPGKPADMTSPYTCARGSSVSELAAHIHRDLADSFKTARLWGTGVFDGQTVQRDHVLHDKDILELHV